MIIDENSRQLIKQGDELFNKKQSLLSLWQEIALNFYPERAEFTVTRTLGSEFADHLMNSYPVIARRDLGNSFSSILRKDDWFSISTKQEPDAEGKAWLEWATGVQRRAMYDRAAAFKRATKEGDHDYSAFGQCAITIELNSARNGLMYRDWHLRDVAWCENVDGAIDTVHQKWKPTALQLVKLFKGNVSQKVKDIVDKHPYREIACRRIVFPADQYESYANTRGFPLVSVFVDEVNNHVMEETGILMSPWVIPRWQTVSGSQYAYSPATVVALADARLIQAMTLVLLDAGEKSADPPMLAVGDAIRSEIDLRAGGVTWVDAAYDERLGEVLRPLTVDRRGIDPGERMAAETKAAISDAFFLSKLQLPMQVGNMTATEVSQRVQEYIRQALPLFEPMEEDYNAPICEGTFNVLMHNGAFGSDIPDSLRGQDVEFKFVSPLKAAADREKGMRLQEATGLVMAVEPIDPTISAEVDFHQAMRDALEGIGVPARWIRSEADAEEKTQEIQQKLDVQQAAAVAPQIAQAAQAAQVSQTVKAGQGATQ